MKVKDFMIKEVITVLPEASIKEVMKTFVEKKIGGVPIVDSGGKLLGIVTDGDILRAIKPVDQHIQNYFTYSILIEEINLESRMSEMKNLSIIKIAKTRNIVTIHPEDELKKVVQLLSKHHFKKLPVVDDENRVVGVLSRGDVIRKIQMTILEGWE
ncbi:CBS domain-containing protein [Neobacillus massiliamazoniensis]|uniref:CBS domain containing membrane protein n=1 Tax=Neobacillus massiliamazoniensis TaxID=1499688 RepID=A0A0U1NS55_9BACI|nr:CBS domain-containing protein [Neobacillus massiliamazoniensis]CRK80893.1 CBS domain containing membrane protein [Neobacillus massiliamazoniensis]